MCRNIVYLIDLCTATEWKMNIQLDLGSEYFGSYIVRRPRKCRTRAVESMYCLRRNVDVIGARNYEATGSFVYFFFLYSRLEQRGKSVEGMLKIYFLGSVAPAVDVRVVTSLRMLYCCVGETVSLMRFDRVWKLRYSAPWSVICCSLGYTGILYFSTRW